MWRELCTDRCKRRHNIGATNPPDPVVADSAPLKLGVGVRPLFAARINAPEDAPVPPRPVSRRAGWTYTTGPADV